MILDCVITAVNENELYTQFIPIFIKTWNKLYPKIDVKIILIAKKIPIEYSDYMNNIILFEPIGNILTSFISQYIRLLYPCILNYKNGVLITDMDMLPMNKTYYIDNIESYDNNKFIYYRGNALFNKKQIAMCYNVATPSVWKEIFKINTINDIKERLTYIFKKNRILEGHGNIGWSIDQVHLYKYVMFWNKKTNNLICLDENKTKFKRLDRNNFILDNVKQNIKDGVYCDYHCYRPMSKYSKLNYDIYDLL